MPRLPSPLIWRAGEVIERAHERTRSDNSVASDAQLALPNSGERELRGRRRGLQICPRAISDH